VTLRVGVASYKTKEYGTNAHLAEPVRSASDFLYKEVPEHLPLEDEGS